MIHPGCADSGVCAREQEEPNILATSSSRKLLSAPELMSAGKYIDCVFHEIPTGTGLGPRSDLAWLTWSQFVSLGLKMQFT